jgi:uncharacterized protein involved in response to NO
MPSAAHPLAPTWRTEPHRLLFPLGAGLATFAVLPFASRGMGGGALALFHSVAQIQGFLTCFLAGFLLTFVPRLTRTAPAEGWEVVSALVLPTLAVLSAWVGDAALASRIWLVLLAIVTAFTVRRLRAGGRARERLAPVLVWVPAAIAAGAVGAVLVGGGSVFPSFGAYGVWSLGRGLLVQGFVTGLVLGIGGWLLPQVMRGEPPLAAGADAARRRRSAALHVVAAVAFFGSFALELLPSPRVGFAVRALVTGAVLLGTARIHRPPALPGLHRRLILLAAWLVPISFTLGALGARLRGAALHVLFVGGFAQIALAVSAHVVLSRGDRPWAPGWRRVGAAAMAGCLAAAFAARIAAAIDLRHVARWLEIAAWAFGAAVAAWAIVVGPALVAPPELRRRAESVQPRRD